MSFRRRERAFNIVLPENVFFRANLDTPVSLTPRGSKYPRCGRRENRSPRASLRCAIISFKSNQMTHAMYVYVCVSRFSVKIIYFTIRCVDASRQTSIFFLATIRYIGRMFSRDRAYSNVFIQINSMLFIYLFLSKFAHRCSEGDFSVRDSSNLTLS